jgi:hypothetical protein
MEKSLRIKRVQRSEVVNVLFPKKGSLSLKAGGSGIPFVVAGRPEASEKSKLHNCAGRRYPLIMLVAVPKASFAGVDATESN